MTIDYDALLRPKKLNQVVGCEQAKIVLNTVITAAKAQRQPVGHILFSGPAGTGKTTLAHVVANEMGTSCFVTTGTNLAAQFTDYETIFGQILPVIDQRGVIFCDEIHRVANLMQDTLLPWLERNELALRYRAPSAGRGVRKGDWVALNGTTKPFTFIGATTRAGLLQQPFADRFKVSLHLDYYDDESIFQIVRRSAWLLELGISDAALRIIAQRSKGIPRLGNNHIWYAKQWAIAHSQYIDTVQAATIMDELGIDELGLDERDRKLLEYLTELNRPIGLTTICAYLSEDRNTVEYVIEPPLIRAELLVKTNRGRIVSDKAIQHMKGA